VRQEELYITLCRKHNGALACTTGDQNQLKIFHIFSISTTSTVTISDVCNVVATVAYINPLNAKLNPTCHLLAFLGAHHILHFSRVRVNCEVICNSLHNCIFFPVKILSIYYVLTVSFLYVSTVFPHEKNL